MQTNPNCNENSDEISENVYDDAYVGSAQYYEDFGDEPAKLDEDMAEQEYESPEKDWDDATWQSYTEWNAATEQQYVETKQDDSDAATYIDIVPLEKTRKNAVKREVIEFD